jgi:hypothetical protein
MLGYPFREFVIEEFGKRRDAWQSGERGPHDECTALLRTFNLMYLRLTEPVPSTDFLTLESLLNFSASTGKRVEEGATLPCRHRWILLVAQER